MAGLSVFLLPFTFVLLFVFPGLFDSSMMSRLAIYPLAGTVIFFLGRKNISLTHILTGAAVGLLPVISLLWNSSFTGGIPFAVRWFSFGLMIIGFSGTVNRWGVRSHIKGLVGAAILTSLLMLFLGADSVTGNANRAGMVLSLGFLGNIVLFNRRKWFSWAIQLVLLSAIFLSYFYISWIACITGMIILFLPRNLKISPWVVLVIMILGQILFSMAPQFAGQIGPSLELRTRIWRSSATLMASNLPLGTGAGSSRLQVFNSGEPELRLLSGGDKRIDFLHSESLTILVEQGIPGLMLLLFLLYWFSRKCQSAEQLSLLVAFWILFTSDLPLATPLGAIPAAFFIGSVSPIKSKTIRIHSGIPILLCVLSLFWCFTVLSGYAAFGNNGRRTVEDLEYASRRIPWEERVFLASGRVHLQNGMILAALEDSDNFLDLYPDYYRGWELRASALSAAGRDSHSAWARATLLIPDNIDFPDRILFALNAVQPDELPPDTMIAIAATIINSAGALTETIRNLPPPGLVFASEKCLLLSRQSRALSVNQSAIMWVFAGSFSAAAGAESSEDLLADILSDIQLYDYLNSAYREEADKVILEIENLQGQ